MQAFQVSEKELLGQLMNYQHPGLLQRMEEKLQLDSKRVGELFQDMKRFLFLAGTMNKPLAPPEGIDEAWHNFILFTKDYEEFCRTHFGRFVHHVPVGPDDVASRDGRILRETIEAARAVFGEGLSSNWSYGKEKCSDKCAPSTNCQPSSRSKCSG